MATSARRSTQPYVGRKGFAGRSVTIRPFGSFPDPEVGYEYPEMYLEIFGKDFVPEPYIQRDYEYAKKHKWYMAARLVTLNDEYSFDKSITLTLDPFIDIIGRNFKQPPRVSAGTIRLHPGCGGQSSIRPGPL